MSLEEDPFRSARHHTTRAAPRQINAVRRAANRTSFSSPGSARGRGVLRRSASSSGGLRQVAERQRNRIPRQSLGTRREGHLRPQELALLVAREGTRRRLQRPAVPQPYIWHGVTSIPLAACLGVPHRMPTQNATHPPRGWHSVSRAPICCSRVAEKRRKPRSFAYLRVGPSAASQSGPPHGEPHSIFHPS